MASRETAAEEAVAFLAVAGVVSNQAGHLRGQWMESATQQRGLAGVAQLLECLQQTHTHTHKVKSEAGRRGKKAFSQFQKRPEIISRNE